MQLQQLLFEYEAFLVSRTHKSTTDTYMRIIRQLVLWITNQNSSSGIFEQFSKDVLKTYITHLEATGYSATHLARVKSAISGFARWLIESKGILISNPTSGLSIPQQPFQGNSELSQSQRQILQKLVLVDGKKRSLAIWALGYWAGCSVSDIAWLRETDTHISLKQGWISVGYKIGKVRDINLITEARRPLCEYIYSDERNHESRYTFTSQRHERLTEAGIHRWWKNIKSLALPQEYPLIESVTFHDLRHDFAHRMCQAGWTLEQVAYYLGHMTKWGTPSLQTTARYQYRSAATHVKSLSHNE
ncbi:MULTISPECIES: tyrosine-type recombinase/integrase [Nostocales]|uniref:Integrase n=1 Tax=Tolypothrix bouteillei VB521301 TaxID=1479485 RepID=A0A0C1NBA2_9CYAN